MRKRFVVPIHEDFVSSFVLGVVSAKRAFEPRPRMRTQNCFGGRQHLPAADVQSQDCRVEVVFLFYSFNFSIPSFLGIFKFCMLYIFFINYCISVFIQNWLNVFCVCTNKLVINFQLFWNFLELSFFFHKLIFHPNNCVSVTCIYFIDTSLHYQLYSSDTVVHRIFYFGEITDVTELN